MQKIDFLKKLRMFLADPDGKIWNDNELFVILDRALEQYCSDVKLFTGSLDFYPDPAGVYHYPENFVDFMVGWNSNGQEIKQATALTLFERSGYNANRNGTPQYIFDDTESYGNFSVYPLPGNNQNSVTCTITPETGEVTDSNYGVFLTEDYGTTLSIDVFDFAGTIFYHKKGEFQDIRDYMAIIYCAMSFAYTADSEFGNAQKAAYWYNIYSKRVAATKGVLHNNSGRATATNYY